MHLHYILLMCILYTPIFTLYTPYIPPYTPYLHLIHNPFTYTHIHLICTLYTPSLITFFILLSPTRNCKITGYDLQLLLMQRNCILNKEIEIKYCSCTKIVLRYTCRLQVLTPRMSQIFLGKITRFYRKTLFGLDKVLNFRDFSRPSKEIRYFSRTSREFKDFLRRLVKFKTFLKIVQSMTVQRRIILCGKRYHRFRLPGSDCST